jgi:hypothetical protein
MFKHVTFRLAKCLMQRQNRTASEIIMRWYHISTVLLALAPSALAAPIPDGGVTAAEVSAALQAKGFQAEVTADKQGDPLIRSASGGSRFGVYFYDCHGSPRCGSIQFSAAFSGKGMDLGKIAEWNRTKRFGRAYIDDDSDPWVEMDMDVEHGATTDALTNDLERWVAVMGKFGQFIHP